MVTFVQKGYYAMCQDNRANPQIQKECGNPLCCRKMLGWNKKISVVFNVVSEKTKFVNSTWDSGNKYLQVRESGKTYAGAKRGKNRDWPQFFIWLATTWCHNFDWLEHAVRVSWPITASFQAKRHENVSRGMAQLVLLRGSIFTHKNYLNI